MKIAVFTETYHPQVNGVVVFLSDILPLLSKKARIVLFAPGGNRLKMENINRNFKIYWVPALPFPLYEGYRMSTILPKELKKILKEEKPDVVHLHAPVLMGLNAMRVSRKLGLPVVATYHTHFPDYIPHLFMGHLPKSLAELAKSPVKKMIAYVFSKADCTTAPTAELRKELEGYGVRNVLHVPNGVRFDKFGKSNATGFLKKYKIPEDKPVVLYVGRVSFEKKLEVLLNAFKKIRNATLVIVGSGPSLKDYKKLAKSLELENVVFTEYVGASSLPDAYAAADIFASPSDSETFGLTFVEAMYFGLPVIGVNRLGAKEVIRNKSNGFLVKPDDADGFAEKITLLLEKPELRKKLGAQGKKDSKKYDMERVAEKFLKLYGKLAKS
ncbi:glycosyltransferase family 1 protein [Candidatus Micrarchaeota archaeon]|nr:glycosyltransferase family 1 protein [Candidatus Micrarchaeota archaeon]